MCVVSHCRDKTQLPYNWPTPGVSGGGLLSKYNIADSNLSNWWFRFLNRSSRNTTVGPCVASKIVCVLHFSSLIIIHFKNGLFLWCFNGISQMVMHAFRRNFLSSWGIPKTSLFTLSFCRCKPTLSWLLCHAKQRDQKRLRMLLVPAREWVILAETESV